MTVESKVEKFVSMSIGKTPDRSVRGSGWHHSIAPGKASLTRYV